MNRMIVFSGALMVLLFGQARAQSTSGQSISLSPESENSWKETVPTQGIHIGGDATMEVASLRFCAAIADRDGRLSCYDDISTHNGVIVNQTDPAMPVAQWVTKINSAKEDYIAGLSSGAVISQEGKKIDHPVVLYFRCRMGLPSLYFKTGDIIGNEGVPVEFSDGDVSLGDHVGRYTLRPSSSGDAFGLWNGEAVSNMVGYLSGTKGFRLVYHLRGTSSYSTRFDMSRFLEDTAGIRRACRL